MNQQKVLRNLIFLIVILSSFAAIIGFATSRSDGIIRVIQSVNGENVELFGKGIYKNDSVGAVSQGIAQDIVTMIVGIPLLLFSLYKSKTFKGRFVLTGTLGYFLYTYTSYVFYWSFNQLFLIYVALMSLSFFAFILSFNNLDLEQISSRFSEALPINFLGNFQIILGIIITVMWMGRLAPILHGKPPIGLEHYTTLVIQALDLGFVVPISIFSGISLKRRRPLGYALTCIILVKAVTLCTSIIAMTIAQMVIGAELMMIETIIFLLIDVFILYCFFVLMKHVERN